MYAATHPYTVDENGNRKYVYCHWGVVDENKKFIPGKRYVFASLEERERLVFPDDWDMSEAKRLSGAKQPGRPAYTDADKNWPLRSQAIVREQRGGCYIFRSMFGQREMLK